MINNPFTNEIDDDNISRLILEEFSSGLSLSVINQIKYIGTCMGLVEFADDERYEYTFGKDMHLSEFVDESNKDFKEIEFGAHFHALPDEWFNKINSAYLSGCRRFDGAIMGWGGCPMASNLLIGNIPTEKLISYFNSLGEDLYLNFIAFESAYNNFKSLIHV